MPLVRIRTTPQPLLRSHKNIKNHSSLAQSLRQNMVRSAIHSLLNRLLNNNNKLRVTVNDIPSFINLPVNDAGSPDGQTSCHPSLLATNKSKLNLSFFKDTNFIKISKPSMSFSHGESLLWPKLWLSLPCCFLYLMM